MTWRTVVVVVAVAALAAGCLLPPTGDDWQDPPCECPNLERIAVSLDWAPGEDVELARSFREADPDQDLLIVIVRGAFTEADLDRALELFVGQGLNAERDGDRVSVEGDGFRAAISLIGSPDANVVLIDTPDEEAEETLQPLIDALGVRDDGE